MQNLLVLDTQKFWDNFRELKHLVPSLMASFVKQCPGSLARIEAAISANDAAGLKSAAHAYKGVLLQIYAPRSGALAADLERRGRAGSTEGAREIYDELVIEIELLLSAIQSLDYEQAAA